MNAEHGSGIRKKILEAIVGYIQEHGYSPTVREIGNMVGLKSTSTVHHHLTVMLDEGVIESDGGIGTPRAIRVVKTKKTNADRIREMSNEELAFVLMCPYDTAGEPADIMPCVKDGSNMNASPKRCMQCTKEWLEKESD